MCIRDSIFTYLLWWANSPTTELEMPKPLAMELMKYCSALTVMQSLEAQHHTINLKISFGRASLPASTCANMRRKYNGDVETPKFRTDLARLVGDLSKLVAIKWSNRSEPWPWLNYEDLSCTLSVVYEFSVAGLVVMVSLGDMLRCLRN